MRSILIAMTAAAAVFVGTAPAHADDYPSKTIRLVVPGPPGNTTDIYARYFATRMAQIMGQPVIVDNKPGGNSFIGVNSVNSAPADGYSILMAGSSPGAEPRGLQESAL